MEENKVMPISKLKNGYGGQCPPSKVATFKQP